MGGSLDSGLRGVCRLLLVALVFSVLFVVVLVVGGVVFVLDLLVAALFGLGVVGVFGLVFPVVFLVFYVVVLAVSLLVLVRVRAMFGGARRGDVGLLVRYDSLGWAVVALVFGGVVPGVVLLAVRRSIRGLVGARGLRPPGSGSLSAWSA